MAIRLSDILVIILALAVGVGGLLLDSRNPEVSSVPMKLGQLERNHADHS